MVSFVAVVVKCQFCLRQCHGYMQILIFQLNGEEGIYEALVKNADSFSGGVSMSVNVQLAFNLFCVSVLRFIVFLYTHRSTRIISNTGNELLQRHCQLRK